MSKEGDKASVFRTTKVRTRLRGDGSWLQRRSEPEAEAEAEAEEKPWVAEVRASRPNGEPGETSPVPSPTKPALPPNKPDTDRAPTSGYLIRGIFTKPDDKPAASSTSNGFSGGTQYKKPSESYRKIAPHTVRPATENLEEQLNDVEHEKRTEAASNVLKKSAVRQQSYVLSAARKYEVKDGQPVNSSPSFVAKRVAVVDDDDSSTGPLPVSAPVAPVTSAAAAAAAAHAPQPGSRKTVETSVRAPAEVPADKPAAPGAVKQEPPAPVSLAEKAPFEGMKPGCTKVDTPLPKLNLGIFQAVYVEPQPEGSDESEQEDIPLVKLTPALPARLSAKPASPAPGSAVPVSRAPLSPVPVSAAPLSPVPASPVPVSRAPLSPVPASAAPLSPVPASPVPVSAALLSPVPASPVPVSRAPLSPVPASAAPLSPVPVSATPLSPVPVSPPPLSPVPASAVAGSPPPLSPVPASAVLQLPIPLSPVPTPSFSLSPAPVSSVTVFTVKTEPILEPEPEPEPVSPSPKPSSNVDTLAALYGTLVTFDTSSTSLKDEEPKLMEEEGGSADWRTTGNSATKEPALSTFGNSEPPTVDLLALDDGPEEPAEPVPASPARWSQELLGGLDSEAKPAVTRGSQDLLANDVFFKTEERSLSMRREEGKPTDETAKGTQSSTETVTVTTRTVIITDKSEEDNADPWSSHVTTRVTESSLADPFDPYPIGTTSPNSSSGLLQPLADISINRAPTTYMENKEPSPEINVSGNALKSLARDIIPIDTDTTSLHTHRSWACTWDTGTPQQTTGTEESRAAEPQGQAGDPQTLIMFERKSSDNDSPWDRWTSPTVYTVPSATGEEEEEEEEEEERREDSRTQTVTTVTTIRETRSEPEPAMDRYESYSSSVVEEDRRVPTPEPDTKKGFVYVKEYLNATEVSSYNSRDTNGGGSDYLTSSSYSYSHSSPSYSSATLSSTCTFCGEQVGNDAKITIEHLNINCHPVCFKCGVCSKPMGDLLYSMFLHGGKVHCESCYSKALD